MDGVAGSEIHVTRHAERAGVSVDPVSVAFGVSVIGVSVVGVLAPVRAHDWWYRIHPMYEDVPALSDFGVRVTRAAWALSTFVGFGFVILGLR